MSEYQKCMSDLCEKHVSSLFQQQNNYIKYLEDQLDHIRKNSLSKEEWHKSMHEPNPYIKLINSEFK